MKRIDINKWLLWIADRHMRYFVHPEKNRSGPQMSKLPPWVALIWPSAQTIFLFRLLEGCRIRRGIKLQEEKK